MTQRYLTKSRFKLAIECPTKLFYTGKKDTYADQSIDDEFLLALADGGFLVGELAKAYFVGCHDIKTLGYEASLKQTNELLDASDSVVIAEAAVKHENLFIRVDILQKRQRHIDLIEVKAKSISGAPEIEFLKKDGAIKKEWVPYLYDIAFQAYVARKAYPDSIIHPFLMLADKDARSPSGALHQKFRIVEDIDGKRSANQIEPLTNEELDYPILRKIDVSQFVEMIFAGTDSSQKMETSFEERVRFFAEIYAKDARVDSPISMSCKTCQFRTSPDLDAAGLRSGYKECWSKQTGSTGALLSRPAVFDVWDSRQAEKHLESGKLWMTDLSEEDFYETKISDRGLTRKQRQWLQVERVKTSDDSLWIDAEGLAAEMSAWMYPLHMIDFETAAPAIPFHEGMHPYEGLAFQYSHHVVYENGSIEHRGEYLNAQTGVFPNFDFLRALKSELEKDKGTIFRYSKHENTYINAILRQMELHKSEVPDHDTLRDFFMSIAEPKNDEKNPWVPARRMVDLLELVKRYYYDPAMKGSNSIKVVLPSVLNRSEFLQQKYSNPIYGSDKGILSINYRDHAWVKWDDNCVIDPYRLLEPVNEFLTSDIERAIDLQLDDVSESKINNGGAAMMAYARLQLEQLSERQRFAIETALKRYCELDTLAMVMIVEGWKDLIGRAS